MARRRAQRRRPIGGIEEIPPKPGYYIAFTVNGKTRRRKASSSHLKARHMLADMRAMFDDGVELDDILASVFGDKRGSALTFQDIADLYKRHKTTCKKAKTRKPQTIRNENSRIDGVCRAEWASTPIKSLRKGPIVRWMDRRQSTVAPSTVNRDLAMARQIINWAIDREYCASNPMSQIKDCDESGRARTVYLTPDECRALIEACCDDIRLIVTIAIGTGLRRGEILSLRWSDIDEDSQFLLVRKEVSKNLSERRLRLGHTIRRGLDELAETVGAEPGTSDTRIFPLTANQLRWRYDKARFSCPALSAGKKKAACFHVLRHTAASIMRQRGLSLGDIMGVLGHQSFKMVTRYAHLGPEVGEKAASLMEQVFSGADEVG